MTVPAGERHDLVLEITQGTLASEPPDAEQTWQATESSWARARPSLEQTIAPRDAQHAWAVLRGLTSAGGGMVAAATMSLPERAQADRSYDYRYAWIRDQAYAGIAAAAAGQQTCLITGTRTRGLAGRTPGNRDGRPGRWPLMRPTPTVAVTGHGADLAHGCYHGPFGRKDGKTWTWHDLIMTGNEKGRY